MIVLGIIPARGGSKSIPLKNIKNLGGRPLISYTIEAAKGSSLISRLVVSTDDRRIAKVCADYDCEVIERPGELSTDTASTESALIHVLEVLENTEGFRPDIVVTLEPTSPFRTSELIDDALKVFHTTDADSVIGVVETRACYGRIVDGVFKHLFPQQPRRRQDREPLYEECGAIYATRTETLLDKKSVLGDRLYPVIVSQIGAIDINGIEDFNMARELIKLSIR